MSSFENKGARKDNDCVNGFIKESQKGMNGVILIDAVIDIVFSYYHILMDRWDVNAIGSKMAYNQLHDEIVMVRAGGFQSAFLSDVVEHGVFKWTFKVTGYNFEQSGYNYLIGIWKTKSTKDTKDLKETFFSIDYKNVYGWLAGCGLKSNDRGCICSERYGTRINNGDIIQMILDLEYKMELKYTVNGKDYGKAFDVEKTKYRAAVMLGARNNCIRLLPNN